MNAANMDETIEQKLAAVGAVEDRLRGLGFAQFRVRHHGDIARIEVDPSEIPRACTSGTRAAIIAAGRNAGFLYVTLDLAGYRTGSMNETLPVSAKETV